MMKAFDIAIVGGGVAGVAAAVAAAAENKSVVLIEQADSVGGDSVHVNVGTICGSFYRSSGAPRIIAHPFLKTFLDRLQHRDENSKPLLHQNGLVVIPYEWKELQSLLNQLIQENGITTMLATKLSGVDRTENKITHLHLTKHDGSTLTINVNLAVVDCTGHAVVSSLSNFPLIHETTYQAASQVFRINGVTSQNEYALAMSLRRFVVKNLEDNQWPNSYKSISVIPGSLRHGKADIKITIPENIDDEKFLDDDNFKQRCVDHVNAFFKTLVQDESFVHATLDFIFPKPGVRVVQRSKGEYILTEEDILQLRQFDDGVAIGAWPIEIWDTDGKLSMTYFEESKGYDIPARCLRAAGADNLYLGGKTISASARAIASARVMGTCIQTGFAAGKLACASSPSHYQEIVKTLNQLIHD